MRFILHSSGPTSSIYLSKDQFTFLCVSVCVSDTFEKGNSHRRAKNLKDTSKNSQSPTIDGPFSDKPDRRHDNPLKPDRTRDDVGKNLANAIVAGFRRRSISFDSFDFMANPHIGQNGKMIKTIKIYNFV